MAGQSYGRRPWTFYVLSAFFVLFVLFLYGPMAAIYAVITTGDPLLARPLEAELEHRLRRDGLEIWDERSSLGIFDLLGSGIPVTASMLAFPMAMWA